MERKDVEQKYKWDLSVIYKDEDAFYKDYSEAEKLIKAYKKHEAVMTDSPEALLSALNDLSLVERMIEKIYLYASLSFSVDTTNNKYRILLTSKSLNLLTITLATVIKTTLMKNCNLLTFVFKNTTSTK